MKNRLKSTLDANRLAHTSRQTLCLLHVKQPHWGWAACMLFGDSRASGFCAITEAPERGVAMRKITAVTYPLSQGQPKRCPHSQQFQLVRIDRDLRSSQIWRSPTFWLPLHKLKVLANTHNRGLAMSTRLSHSGVIYLKDSLTSYVPTPPLRSAKLALLQVPQSSHFTLAQNQSFSVASPAL